MPKITVVIPTYNAERYVADALSSVRNQTLNEVEVVLVDDGSTDGTVSAARRFEPSLDLRIIEQRNAGPSAARNAGIRAARARYCALLDADDVMLPELLAKQSAQLDAHAEVGLALTDIVTFNDRGTIREGYWNLAATGDVLDRLLVENFVTTSAVMARTDCFIDAGLFPEHRRVAEDYELWLNIAVRWKVALIDEPLLRYRYAEGSLSSNKLVSAQCALDVIETFWRRHPDIHRERPAIYRRSLSRHLRTAGAAALSDGQRATAVRYLLGALRHNFTEPATWKTLIKSLLPTNTMARAPRQAAKER